jgi:hypothetical protein
MLTSKHSAFSAQKSLIKRSAGKGFERKKGEKKEAREKKKTTEGEKSIAGGEKKSYLCSL